MAENHLLSSHPAAEQVYSLTEAAVQLTDKGELEQATSAVEEAAALAGDEPELQALVCVARTAVARRQARATDALLHAHQALQLFVQAGNTPRQVSVLITIGTLYFELGDYGQAIEALSQATDQAITTQQPLDEAAAAFWLGACYQRMGLFKESLAAIDRSEALYRPANELVGLARALNCRHIVYREMSLQDEEQREQLQQQAQATLDQATQYAREAGNQQMLAVLYGNQGRLFAASGQYERALRIYEEEYYAERHHSPLNRAVLCISMGTAQRHLGRYQEALASLQEALAVAEGAQHKREIALAHQELAQTYELLGDMAQALHHFKQYHDVERVILSEQNDRVARVTALRLDAERGRYEAELQAKLAQQEHAALREQTGLLEQLLAERTTALERQNEMLQLIDDLSTPVLPLLDGVLVAPVIGRLDERRCARMTEELLGRVAREHARVVLLDITGVLIIDPSIAAAFLDLARAVRLLGCHVIMVGIRPEIAEAMVGMGLNLSGLSSYSSLAEGVRAALTSVGLSLTAVPGSDRD